METSPYRIPETALRSWDPHSKRKAYFEGQEEALRQAQSKTPKKAIHALIEEAIKATSARVQAEGQAARAEKATGESGLDILGAGTDTERKSKCHCPIATNTHTLYATMFERHKP